MDEIRFTFVRHACKIGKHDKQICYSEYFRTYFVGLEIEKLGKADAIYSSFALPARTTAQALGIALNCENVKCSSSLNGKADAPILFKFLEELKTAATSKKWKHIVCVINDMTAEKMGIGNLSSLDYFSVEAGKFNRRLLKNCHPVQTANVQDKYPELFRVSRFLMDRLCSAEKTILLNLLQKLNSFRNWEDIDAKLKAQKRLFLRELGITDLTEEADWSEIFLHEKSQTFDFKKVYEENIQKVELLSDDQHERLSILLSPSTAGHPLFDREDPAYFEGLTERGTKVSFARIAEIGEYRFYEIIAIVEPNAAAALKGVNLLLAKPSKGVFCSFSYRTAMSSTMQKVKDDFEAKQMKNKRK